MKRSTKAPPKEPLNFKGLDEKARGIAGTSVVYFDAYNSTVPARTERLLELLRIHLKAYLGDIVLSKGMHSYARMYKLLDKDGNSILQLLHDDEDYPKPPHIRCQGHHAQILAMIIREIWPQHAVTRADAAIDFDEPGLFDLLLVAFRKFASRNNLAWEVVGDDRKQGDRDGTKGRTFYVGNRTSLAMLRVYEKGKQMLAETRSGDPIPSEHWVRVELEVKGQTRYQKLAVSSMEPSALWGVSRWTREAHEMIFTSAVGRQVMWQAREKDLAASFARIVGYAGVTLLEVRDAIGSDEEFVEAIRKELLKLQDLRTYKRHIKAVA